MKLTFFLLWKVKERKICRYSLLFSDIIPIVKRKGIILIVVYYQIVTFISSSKSSDDR